jgi:hydroxymethylpyrimidine pyrophosphatase-like HAD family hydrolase
MHYLALATDYDGTIADDGVVDELTLAALERLRGCGRRLILVTGRDLTDLRRAMPRLDLFDLVVAENGALLYDPINHEERALGDAPPPAFVERLRELEVAPLWMGRVIVATWERNAGKVLSAIDDLGLKLHVTFNKTAIMVLPAGVTKASGLRGALAQLGVSPLNCIGVGDADDLVFLDVCGLPVAVANALPSVKQRAAFVTMGTRGAGVAELIDAYRRAGLVSRRARSVSETRRVSQ